MLLEVLVAQRRALHEFSPCEPKGKPCSFSCCIWGRQHQSSLVVVVRALHQVMRRLCLAAGVREVCFDEAWMAYHHFGLLNIDLKACPSKESNSKTLLIVEERLACTLFVVDICQIQSKTRSLIPDT